MGRSKQAAIAAMLYPNFSSGIAPDASQELQTRRSRSIN